MNLEFKGLAGFEAGGDAAEFGDYLVEGDRSLPEIIAEEVKPKAGHSGIDRRNRIRGATPGDRCFGCLASG